MKRRRLKVLAAAMAVGLTVFAGRNVKAEPTIVASGSCGENANFVLNSDRILTISGEGEIALIDWVSTIGDFDKLVIESGITSIGYSAFSGCSSLTEVVIPDSVTSIGELAFYNCSSLKEIVIPNSVTSIGVNTFNSCSSLTKVVIPDSVASIGECAFYDCSGLTEIVLPDSVTSIGHDAFCGCSSLTKVVIPNSVTSIGENAFSDCSSLTKIVIPDSVASIAQGIFFDCSSLTEIVLPNSVTSIGESAFNGCSSLTEIIIPGSVVDMGSSVFRSCSKLEKVVFLDGVKEIKDIFYDCGNLKEVIIPASVTSIGDNAFINCSNITEIIIPNGVVSISGGAFSGCNLTEITIPASVKLIGPHAFADCTKLEKVTFLGDAPDIDCLDVGASYVQLPFNNLADNAVAYYPAGNSTWDREIGVGVGLGSYVTNIKEAYGGNFTWIAAGDVPSEELEIRKDLVTDNTYTKGSSDNAVIRCTGELKDFISVIIDGELVDSSNYTLTEGSTILTFKPDYMDTLTVGEHAVTLNYTENRKIDTTLTIFAAKTEENPKETSDIKPEENQGQPSIKPEENNPVQSGESTDTNNSGINNTNQEKPIQTGDSASIAVWILISLLAAGSSFIVIMKKHSN